MGSICSVKNDSFSQTENCTYQGNLPDSLPVKFWLVVVFGTSLCLIAIPENLYLLYLFLSRRTFRNSPLFYMAILALFDLFLSPAYVLIQSAMVWFDCMVILTMYQWYLGYIIPLLAATRTFLVASNFLILTATFERFLKTKESVGLKQIASWFERHRGLLAFCTVCFGFSLDGHICFSLRINKYENCSAWTEYRIEGLALFGNPHFHYIYAVYVNAAVKTFIPFFLLLYMNFAIIKAVKREHQNHISEVVEGENKTSVILQRIPQSESDSSKKLRDATRLLVLVVFMYLISNVLLVILKIWEFYDEINFDKTKPREGQWTIPPDFQDYGSDVSNILVVLCRNLRLPIYLLCNQAIRSETRNIARKLCFFCYDNSKHHGRYQAPLTEHQEELVLMEPPQKINGLKTPLVTQFAAQL